LDLRLASQITEMLQIEGQIRRVGLSPRTDN